MNKKYMMAALGVLGISGAVFAAVLLTTLPTDVTVNEAFTTTETAVSVSAYPGETKCDVLNINNAASVTLNAKFTYSETSNPSLVSYTTDTPKTVPLVTGANAVEVCFTIASDSQAGLIGGYTTVERVA